MFELIWYSVGPWALEVWGTGPVFAVMLVIMASVVILNRVLPAARMQRLRPVESPHIELTPNARSNSPSDEPSIAHSALVDAGDAWRTYTTASGAVVQELGEPTPRLTDAETQRLIIGLRLELAEARAVAKALQGIAVARVVGRAYEWRGHALVLAVPDQDGHQRIVVRVPDEADRVSVAVGMDVELIAVWSGGRLNVERIVSAEVNADPLPELPEPAIKAATVPDWFDSKAKNQKRPFLKASDGSSSVSELRVHLVWATKRRGKALTAPMIDRLKVLMAEAVRDKGLGRLLAVNGESDHVHVALWLPANLAGSEAAGILKSYTSRILRREFPELKAHHDEALWQRGCFVGSIGAAGHLETVLRYINEQQTMPQTLQGDQEGAFDDLDGEDEVEE